MQELATYSTPSYFAILASSQLFRLRAQRTRESCCFLFATKILQIADLNPNFPIK